MRPCLFLQHHPAQGLKWKDESISLIAYKIT